MSVPESCSLPPSPIPGLLPHAVVSSATLRLLHHGRRGGRLHEVCPVRRQGGGHAGIGLRQARLAGAAPRPKLGSESVRLEAAVTGLTVNYFIKRFLSFM